MLDAPFSEAEIKEAIFSCYPEGAPGPDGLSFLFYQKFWEIIKSDIMAMFTDFCQGTLDIQRLNFALVTLVPKVSEACNMKQFRPISLINCSLKMFSKLLTNRLGKVAQRLVATNQSAFIKGRYILESVVVANEIVHSLHRNKEKGVIIKLDYEKAYDRVSWEFLFEVLNTRGFSPNWIHWIKCLVVGGSVGILVNGEETPYFKPSKGLRQGDPLSPLLFNLVGDAFTRILDRAANKCLVQGVLQDFRPGGILSLQYADDTILFSSVDKSHLWNLKHSIMWFEQLSGMRVNFHKSEILTMNLEEEESKEICSIFNCPAGSFPLKYLGAPLHFEKLTREELQPLVDKLLHRIQGWRGKLLSLAARALLIKTCLASIPTYLHSFIKFPKWAIETLNTHMSNYLWNDIEGAHKYHLANWELVSLNKDYGGLGLPNLRDLNICLLASWLKRYEKDKNKLWRELIDYKYKTNKPNIFQDNSVGSSVFFKGFMSAVHATKMGYRWIIGNGKRVRFWEDNWLGSSSLAIQYWSLYRYVNEKNQSVADLWDGVNLKCTFRRMGDVNLMVL